MLVIQRRMLIGPDVLRPLEHQVLEQVREAGAAGLLVLRSDVIPDRQVHDGRRVIFEDRPPAARSAAWSSCSRTWWAGRSSSGAARSASSTTAADQRPARDGTVGERIIAAIMSRGQARFERRQPRLEIGHAPCAAPAGAARARPLRATRRRRRPACRRRAGPASTSFVTADLAPTIAPAPEAHVAGGARLPRHHHVVVEHGAAGDARPARRAARCGRC